MGFRRVVGATAGLVALLAGGCGGVVKIAGTRHPNANAGLALNIIGDYIQGLEVNNANNTNQATTNKAVSELTARRRASATAYGGFTNYWAEHNTLVDGKPGMTFHFSADIYNGVGTHATLMLNFCKKVSDTHYQLIDDRDSKYCDENRHVATSTELKPIYDPANYPDIRIGIPYEQFDLGNGDHEIAFTARLINKTFGTYEQFVMNVILPGRETTFNLQLH